MTIEFDYDAGRNRLAVRGELTIYHAAEALAQLQGRAGLALDLAEISEMDAAGLQLLLAGQRDAAMTLAAASDPVGDLLRLAGLAHLLEAAT